jgi:hypothetical protein
LLANLSAQPEPLGLTELQMAFERLVHEMETHLKVCIFIDGLDEYDGDHYDICQFLLRVTSQSHIKDLISSRQYNIFQDSFGNLPRLRLQDLTFRDIQAYVADKLYANEHNNWLKLADKSFAEGLVEEIAQKAEGVFLWVMLVVRSLLNGLMNRDGVVILQERLYSMPSDLEEFYDFMLSSMEPRYRQQGSRLQQLVARSVEIQNDDPLSLLQLAYAEDSGDNIDSTIGSPMNLVTGRRESFDPGDDGSTTEH